MDCFLPTMSGMEATRRIRQMAHHRRTPIIAVTANQSAESRVSCFDAGMSDFMPKPLTAQNWQAIAAMHDRNEAP